MKNDLLAIVAGIALGALLFDTVKLLGQENEDVPKEPGQCKIWLTAQGKHEDTYQLTCSDPQPDSIAIYHFSVDSFVVHTSRAH